jgi:hypothetical protein
MAFLRILARTEIRTAFAVFAVATMIAGYMLISAAMAPQSMLPPLNWSTLAFLYTVALGLPVALVIGAPIYALLSFKKAASWPFVLLMGALPGIVILYVMKNENGLAAWFIGCGIAVASLTHLMSDRCFPRFWRGREDRNAL